MIRVKGVHFRFICVAMILAFFSDSPVHAQLLTGFDEPAVQVSSVPVARQPSSSVSALTQGSDRLAVRPSSKKVRDVESEPVDLQADDLSYDDNGRIVLATGNVVLEQAGRRLQADGVRYDLQKDQVQARGNVVLNDRNGDVHYARDVALSNEFKDGRIVGVRSVLADGSQFSAEEGVREGGLRTILTDAAYTACEPCKDDPDGDPIWQIKAKEVRHDKDEHRVVYKDARMEFAGVPVFYMPYLSHSDGSIERKSGLIAPSAGFTSDLGFFVTNNYYVDIAPNKDATVGLMASTQEAPMALVEYRQRWRDAALEVNGGLTYSSRRANQNGQAVTENEEVRGFVKGNARWDINEKWRSGINVDWASDDQFLRQYDLDTRDVLENEIFAERFSGRNYTVGRLLTFQDTRIEERQQQDQPEVLPEIITSFVGTPGSVPVLGGRWQVDGSVLGLRREGGEQDTGRLSLGLGWQKRLVSDTGLLTTVDGTVRGDFYNVRDLGAMDETITESRVFPQIHVKSSYPVAKQFDRMQVRVAPVAAVTFAPNLNIEDDIPNEDSQDVQIDASNIVNANRFPGLDRVEDQSRVTYGGQIGAYGHEGSFATVFLGQSQRFDNDDNPFPVGSGLDDKSSDVVGQVRAQYADAMNLNYRFQLDNENLSSSRHEVDLRGTVGPLSLSSTYLFAKALEGTGIDESREQLDVDTVYRLTKDWALRSGAVQDLGADPGLRKAYAGLNYEGQCLSWALTGQRNFTDDASGDSDTEIFFRIGLKNLGEFQSGL